MLLRYVFKKADWITSLAPHMTEAMIKLGGSQSKIDEIIFGINTEIFNKKNRQLPSDKFVITSTRNLEPVYNIPHFLKAIAIVRPQISNLKVNIIGEGSLVSELKTIASELNIADVVTFHGKITQDKVVEFLNGSHISVTVSLSDGNNLSLIEAMACGAYPIATDILANHQWIKDGVNGSLVKINDVNGLADNIMKVYNNFDNCIDPAMRESDKIIAEKGSWNVNMQKMELNYKRLINDAK
jgi:glycosyltransferase involved in cell wall biosynthesis